MKQIHSVGQKVLAALMTMMAMLAGQSAFAQIAKGKVTSTSGEPVIGASVLIPGTTTGAITDIDGNFELNAAPAPNSRFRASVISTSTLLSFRVRQYMTSSSPKMPSCSMRRLLSAMAISPSVP